MYSIFMSVSFSWILFILPTNSQRSRTLLHSIQDGIMCWIGVSLHINIGVSGPYSAPKQMYITAYKYASGPASMAQHFKFTLVFRIFTMRYAKRVDYIRMCTYHRIHMHQNEGCAMRHIRRRTAKKKCLETRWERWHHRIRFGPSTQHERVFSCRLNVEANKQKI